MPRTFAAVAFGLTLCASGSASAQEFLKDRRFQEGIGVQAGDFELHPGIAGEMGYDSNWFLRSHKTGTNVVNAPPSVNVEPAAVLRVTPAISLTTGSARRSEVNAGSESPLKFTAGASATYREFFGVKEIRDQRNVSVNGNLRLDILPGRPWGGSVFGNYQRAINPSVLGNPDLSYNRHNITGGAELSAQPASGTLDWHLGYTFNTTLFEDTQGKGFDSVNHEFNTRGRWKFRPRTALFYDASVRTTNYINLAPTNASLANGVPLRARLGVNGLITSRFSLLAAAGYGSSFFSTANNKGVKQFDSMIAQVEASFYPTAAPSVDAPQNLSLSLTSISIGYLRDFQMNLVGNFNGLDRGYLKFAYMFAGKVLLSADGGVGAIQYPDFFFSSGALRHPGATDIRIDATLYAEYRLTNSFAFTATGKYGQNISNILLPEEITSAGATTPALFDFNWRRIEAFGGVRWFL
ncbi:MAG: outer membrane beta-barrel protein [Polyangiaceae bacterium]